MSTSLSSTFGPKLGLRQMVQARYSFGFWPTMLPAGLNLVRVIPCENTDETYTMQATMMGYLILSCILGGSLLSSASVGFDPVNGEVGGGISWDVGIVIISLIGLTVRTICYI
jgi:hypothetical protein